MTNHDPEQPMLAGLEIRPELGEANVLRVAVVATITALRDEDLLQPRHAALCQLALELADAVTAGRRSGRASAAAMAAAQLRETLQALPEPSTAGAAEKFAAWIESLKDEESNATP